MDDSVLQWKLVRKMMWVVRAGQGSIFYQKYIDAKRVYLPWNGYSVDLNSFETKTQFRTIVESEKQTTNKASLSNWTGQLISFVKEIHPGDYVLIPTRDSHSYSLTRITGGYEFDLSDVDGLFHSRMIDVIWENIPRDIFTQEIIYSLGAFRTLFKVKHEEVVLHAISKWLASEISMSVSLQRSEE